MNQLRHRLLHLSRFLRLFLLPIGFAVLAACQGQGIHRAYSGEPRPADQVAMLTIPAEFNLQYLDGDKYSSLADGARLELLPGSHQLVIEYDVFWSTGSDSYERVVSQPVMLNFKVSSGKAYKLTFKTLKNVKESKLYATKPEVKIIDLASKEKIALEHKYKLADKAIMASFVADNPMAGGDARSKVPKMLEYWWQQADREQQQSFLKWAGDHSKSVWDE